MKKVCNEIMKISPNVDVGMDYSGIALLWFFLEEVKSPQNTFDIIRFSEYLYRFYADTPRARSKHYHKMINNLFHYMPCDFLSYAKGVIINASRVLSFLSVQYDSFTFDLPLTEEEFVRAKPVFYTLILSISKKHLGKDFTGYSSAIEKCEYINKTEFDLNTRVFSRVLERRNYCFICDEQRLSHLVAILLKKNQDAFDPNDYILMCCDHATAFLNRDLVIKKNGYPYLNGKRLMEHLAIDELKNIRHNLSS